MSLAGLRTAVIDSIESNVSAFQTVQAHGGRFSRAELKRVAMKSPAALVTIMGGPIDREAGSMTVNSARVVVFIVTRGSAASKRDTAVLTLVELVAQLAVQNSWAYADAKAPEGMRIDNLYSGDIDREGVALWSVSWIQRTDILPYDADDLAALPEFRELHADWDLAPADGVIDMEDIVYLWSRFMSAYGHLYVSSPIASSIAVIDTYQKAAGVTTLKSYSDADMPANNRLRHTGTVDKPFKTSASGSLTVSADAKVTLALAKGGVVDEDTEVELEMTSAEGAESFALEGILSLDENEYVEVWVKADDTINVTLTKLNVAMAAT